MLWFIAGYICGVITAPIAKKVWSLVKKKVSEADKDQE